MFTYPIQSDYKWPCGRALCPNSQSSHMFGVVVRLLIGRLPQNPHLLLPSHIASWRVDALTLLPYLNLTTLRHRPQLAGCSRPCLVVTSTCHRTKTTARRRSKHHCTCNPHSTYICQRTHSNHCADGPTVQCTHNQAQSIAKPVLSYAVGLVRGA